MPPNGTANKATNDEQWSFKDLVTIVPIVATTFAFAYVVGYFYAYDIHWLPFFSLSEHTVFAIRALPMAIAASVVFVIALTFEQILCRCRLFWVPWVRKHSQILLRFGTYFWIGLLLVAAGLAYWDGHLGLSLSFLIVAFCAYIHHGAPPIDPMSFANILYWATTLMVFSFLFGYVSAKNFAWSFEKNWYFQSPNPLFVQTDKERQPTPGVIAFVGSENVLFYDYKAKQTILLKRSDINTLFQCKEGVPAKIDDACIADASRCCPKEDVK